MISQSEFRTALLDPARAVPDGLLDGEGRPAGRRFSVYRNNVAVSLRDALKTGFPVITKLIGEANMDGLTGLYLRAHPPKSPMMMFYGDEFAAFIAGTPQLSRYGYLPDIARLELALRHSYHAADTPPVAPNALGALPPEEVMATRLSLAPALRLVRSPWPIHDIWRFNTEQGAPKPRAIAQDVLITRPEFDPVPEALPSGGATFVDALISGRTLGEAHAAASGEEPGFDLAAPLTMLLQGNAITGLTTT